MIKVENLTKQYVIYKKRLSAIKYLFGIAKEGRDYEIVRPLRNVNLEVPTGSVHGIIGMNGAGKSTLLKILTGVLDKTSGSMVIEGRVASLLELGTGFHPDLTGRENVYINGSVLGFSKQEIDLKIESIVKFAELGDYFDRAVKTYSSGMYVRLAFSFAVAVEPDVLIIDEALSVGDAYFQQKCLKKIQEFRERGTTILFVSHDPGAVRLLCQQVTLLSHGEVVFSGEPIQAMDLYNDIIAGQKKLEDVQARADKAREIDATSTYSSGNEKMKILGAKIYNNKGLESVAVVSGSKIAIKVEAVVNADSIIDPTCGILIRDRLGYDVFGINTHQLGKKSGPLKKGEKVIYQFDLDLNLGAGDYTLTIALHSFQSHVDDNYHWLDRALVIQVLPTPDYTFVGVARLEPNANINRH
jgi:lipopolysaccharide transport system ATP-binding protein